ILVVNKSDGDRIKLANQARAHYLNATHLLPLKSSNWPPEVLACSALENTGITEIWQRMEAYKAHIQATGWFKANRNQQAQYWLEDALETGLKDLFYNHPEVKARLAVVEPEVIAGRLSAIDAAMQVLAAFRKGM
ncbi:MAG: methylmalonyl Co-A mutase-associated GTPase MeaB, partial [Saprospiraceae bacterium]|nr:methylmalonyl Co-A mutase-associated GTPase MeaB [Saprospiraceae bacterium]